MDLARLRVEDRHRAVLFALEPRGSVERAVPDAQVMPAGPPPGNGCPRRIARLEQPEGASGSEVDIDAIGEVDPHDARALGLDFPVRDSRLAPGVFPIGSGEKCHLLESGKTRHEAFRARDHHEGRSPVPLGADHQPLLRSCRACAAFSEPGAVAGITRMEPLRLRSNWLRLGGAASSPSQTVEY